MSSPITLASDFGKYPRAHFGNAAAWLAPKILLWPLRKLPNCSNPCPWTCPAFGGQVRVWDHGAGCAMAPKDFKVITFIVVPHYLVRRDPTFGSPANRRSGLLLQSFLACRPLRLWLRKSWRARMRSWAQPGGPVSSDVPIIAHWAYRPARRASERLASWSLPTDAEFAAARATPATWQAWRQGRCARDARAPWRSCAP
jgi:hypothetical protein